MIIEFLNNNQSSVLFGISACIFLIVSCATYMFASRLRTRENIRRRALSPVSPRENAMHDRRALRHQKLARTNSLLSAVATHFVPVNKESVSLMRKNLNRAGFFQPGAMIWYYFIRVTLAILLPASFFAADQIFGFELEPSRYLTYLIAAALAGLMAPGKYISRRTKAMQQQCRDGFPDFMDLMVVCAEAGISVDQAIGRVGRELTQSYPYLGICLHLATLELRAGRPLGEAFDTLSQRMGIEEAHNLGSLLQQSEELGTSLSDALRVYSEEMRDKRMSRAEEKAHALPAKMTVPLTAFVFPVILVVILLPVYVRVSTMM